MPPGEESTLRNRASNGGRHVEQQLRPKLLMFCKALRFSRFVPALASMEWSRSLRLTKGRPRLRRFCRSVGVCLFPAIAFCGVVLSAAPASARAHEGISEGLFTLLPQPVQRCLEREPAENAPWQRQSVLIPVEDGTGLAADIYLPGNAQRKLHPTVFATTRYWRSHGGDTIPKEYQPWIDQGYSVVVADVRGTGASFGRWFIPYSLQEAKDVGFLAKWIARQPWSDGSVVTTGVSYLGTTSLTSPAFGAPAVKVVIPRFADYDMYDDLLFPGGVAASQLILDWGRLVRGLDLNQPDMGRTVRPVDGEQGQVLLDQAIDDHRKVDGGFDQAVTAVTFRDDRPAVFGRHSLAEGGAYQLGSRIERSGVPILGWGSWMDSGIAQGMINRFVGWTNPQFSIIGPWTHGARAQADPFKPANSSIDPSAVMQRRIDRCFADLALKGPGFPPSRIVYYTLNKGGWNVTDRWPIKGTKPTLFHASQNGGLSLRASPQHGADTRVPDLSASTGKLNRWMTQAGAATIDYGDRRLEDKKLFTYQTEPLTHDVEVTGTAEISLRIISNKSDAIFVVYLEDVSPDGRVTYITEGSLRAIQRRLGPPNDPYAAPYPTRTFLGKDAAPLIAGKAATLQFQMMPTSVLFRAGHRIRIAIANGDDGNFIRIPADAEDFKISVVWGGERGSAITLPIVTSE